MPKLSRIGALPGLPLSARFLSRVEQDRPLSLYPESTRLQRSIGAICLPSTAKQVPAGALEEPTLLVDLENVGSYGEISGASEVSSVNSSRISFQDDDLITTRLRPYLLKVAENPGRSVLGSPEWITLRVNRDVFRPRLLFYILNTKRYAELSSVLSTGKQHPRIHEETLSVIELPLLTLEEQDSLIAKLDEILSRSFVLLREASGITDSIDPVFEKYFGLSLDVIKTAPGDRSIRLPLKEIAESRDARFSYKYHAPSVIRARKRLRSLSRYRLRDLLKEPAVLGDGVSPDEYAKDTGMYYLSMVGLKRWRLERDGLNQVTADYFDSHEAKHVQEGDVLMARAGEGTIGKIALVDQPIRAVCSDFVIRMRPDQSKLRPDFLRYCLTTSYYQHLVYGDKKGLGNNTNIFPNQVHEFPILEASLKLQETVCGELNAAAERAAVNLDTAKRLRDEIEETLNAALSA